MLFLYSVDRLIQVIHWKHLHTHHVVCPDIFSCGSVKQTEMDNLKKASHNSVVRLANHTGRGLLTHRKTGYGRSETLSQLSFDNVLKFSIKLKECLCSYLTLAAATSKTNWIRGFLCLKNRKKMAQSDCGIYCSGQFSGVLKSQYYIYYYSFWKPYKYRQVHTGL